MRKYEKGGEIAFGDKVLTFGNEVPSAKINPFFLKH